MGVRIRAPSRIHITLIDLNGSIGRVDGGVGLALENPFIEIEVKESDEIAVSGEFENRWRFEEVAFKFQRKFGMGIGINIKNSYPSHVGLGSGTQISLAVGKAYTELHGIEMNVRDIAEFTGRGGTSGIGVAVFECGGFIVDGGHSKRDKSDFLPSSFSKAPPPPVIARYDFPDWDVHLFIPSEKGFAGLKEKDLFEKNTPLSIDDVREISHLVLMKLMPSVVEHDLDEFAKAVYRIQHLGFKRAEVSQYGQIAWGFIELMKDYGAVGLSSTGPTLYFIGGKKDAEIGLRYLEDQGVVFECISSKARNRGAEIGI